jgi:integrase
MSHLSAIFTLARPAWGIPLDAQEMKDALIVCNRLGLTRKSTSRDRRPTIDELNKILSHFETKSKFKPNAAPMHLITLFALFSTRRQNEITRLEWQGLDVEYSRILVSDMKNPGDKIGNHVWCDLPEPALKLILKMPKKGKLIFPYKSDTISSSFTNACRALAIKDLRFHDLRHEGASRLFEMGMTIPQVSSVTGHRSWQSLQRYTHLKQRGDKFADWHWLERL